jgi:hypothetical protein
VQQPAYAVLGGCSLLSQCSCPISVPFRESIFHTHGIVIYRDMGSPVSKNKALKDELETFKAELMKQWEFKSQL